jgi:hypothetical protein
VNAQYFANVLCRSVVCKFCAYVSSCVFAVYRSISLLLVSPSPCTLAGLSVQPFCCGLSLSLSSLSLRDQHARQELLTGGISPVACVSPRSPFLDLCRLVVSGSSSAGHVSLLDRFLTEKSVSDRLAFAVCIPLAVCLVE